MSVLSILVKTRLSEKVKVIGRCDVKLFEKGSQLCYLSLCVSDCSTNKCVIFTWTLQQHKNADVKSHVDFHETGNYGTVTV